MNDARHLIGLFVFVLVSSACHQAHMRDDVSDAGPSGVGVLELVVEGFEPPAWREGATLSLEVDGEPRLGPVGPRFAPVRYAVSLSTPAHVTLCLTLALDGETARICRREAVVDGRRELRWEIGPPCTHLLLLPECLCDEAGCATDVDCPWADCGDYVCLACECVFVPPDSPC